MIRLSIYAKYKLDCLLKWIKGLKTLSNAWVAFASFTSASIIIYYVEGTGLYLYAAAFAFAPLLVLTIIIDYHKGDYMHWYRNRYKQKAIEKVRESENNG